MTYLKFYLAERGMKLYELARLSGLNEPLVTNIKNGRVNPKPHEVQRLAAVLGVPADLLMKEVPVPPVAAEAAVAR